METDFIIYNGDKNKKMNLEVNIVIVEDERSNFTWAVYRSEDDIISINGLFDSQIAKYTSFLGNLYQLSEWCEKHNFVCKKTSESVFVEGLIDDLERTK